MPSSMVDRLPERPPQLRGLRIIKNSDPPPDRNSLNQCQVTYFSNMTLPSTDMRAYICTSHGSGEGFRVHAFLAKWHQAMIMFWTVHKKRTGHGSVTQTFLEAPIIWNRKLPNLDIQEKFTRTPTPFILRRAYTILFLEFQIMQCTSTRQKSKRIRHVIDNYMYLSHSGCSIVDCGFVGDGIWIWIVVASLHKDIIATMCVRLRACDRAQLASECRYRSC